MSVKKSLCILLGLACISLAGSSYAKPNAASEKVVYSEQGFIQAFDGKSRDEVQQVLGKPYKKETAVRPVGADEYTEKAGDTRPKKDAIEMWYYSKIVRFNDKKIYKTIELTFANDKCVNFSFAF